jgi:5-methylcytosine-specific restriction protein A
VPWDTSDRRSRLPDDWPIRRVRVLRRDSYRCQARDSRGIPCGKPANQVDHIEHGDNHADSNLQALCKWHHDVKSSAEGIEARKAKGGYRRQAREPEPHPLSRATHF